MATFTITTNLNWESSSFSTRAGNDTYNINGAILTIDTDTRYAANANATTGNLGQTNISATLGGQLLIDGTNVRLIAYTSGSGNVPAIGTTITNSSGGITGYLLGVWSALNVAPTTAGSAMPSAGFIKIKNASGSFTSGALTGIGATSSGADVAGWIEVVAVDTQALVCSRLGSVVIDGAWFEVGNTSGSSNQTIQMPASLTNTYYPGVWIETAIGSNIFEFYGNVGSATTVYATDAVRGKIVWISAQGSLIIAKTSFGGYVPVSGLKIRVPNILLITCTSGAPTVNSYNSTISSRFRFNTAASGVISISKAVSTWYNNFVSPYALTFSNVGFIDSFLVSNISSATTWDTIGVGVGTNINTLNSYNISGCLFGGTVSNSVFVRTQYGNSAINSASLVITTIFDFTFSNCKFYSLNDRVTAANCTSWIFTSGSNITLDSCTAIGGIVTMTSALDSNIVDLIYCDLITGATTSSLPLSACGFSRCTNCKLDGATFGGLTNTQSYSSIVSLRDNINFIVRNIGLPATPLSMGSANACNTIVGGSFFVQTGNIDIKMQHLYVTNLRSGELITQSNGDSGIIMENCWGQNTDTIPTSALNVVYKSLFTSTAVPTSFVSVYGTHFFDTFTSTTAGNIGLFMNESSPTSSAYVVTSLSAGSGFTATGALVMSTANDNVIWTWPHYILGYTSFTAIAPTVTGTNSAPNNKYEYDIDKNDDNGFTGSFKNFYYQRTGGATTNGSAIITMTSTTGVAIGDRVYGTNIIAGTNVLSVDSATQCTLSANSTGTSSGLAFIFSALNGETGISSTLGFKLKIKITCTTSSALNTITGCYCVGTTDSTSQLATYPLDVVTATITVQDYLGAPIQDARVAIYKSSDNTELMNVLTDVTGIASGDVTYLTDIPIYIRIRKSSTGTDRYINNDSVGTITNIGFSTTIVLIADPVATP